MSKDTLYLKADGTYINIFQSRMKELGISSYRLAQITGISRAALSLYWKGEREPTLTNTLKIAEALQYKVPLISF
jgi:transcriptional regulator with XRE-family HTH domain